MSNPFHVPGLPDSPLDHPEDWQAETLDNRHADRRFYSGLLTAEDYHQLGIDSQTADSLSDAVDATLQGINLNRR